MAKRNWSLESIRKDQARFEAKMARREDSDGDPWPPGLSPEQLGLERVAGDWDGFEPNTYGGT